MVILEITGYPKYHLAFNVSGPEINTIVLLLPNTKYASSYGMSGESTSWPSTEWSMDTGGVKSPPFVLLGTVLRVGYRLVEAATPSMSHQANEMVVCQ